MIMKKTKFLLADNISSEKENYSISISVEKKGKNDKFLPGAVCNCGCGKSSDWVLRNKKFRIVTTMVMGIK